MDRRELGRHDPLLRVVRAEVLRGRGCDVTLAAIEFTDPRYARRFSQFPMPRPFLEVVAMIPAELRRRPAKIGIPAVVTNGTTTWCASALPPGG